MKMLHWRPLWEAAMLDRTIEWYKSYHENGEPISSHQLTAYQAELL